MTPAAPEIALRLPCARCGQPIACDAPNDAARTGDRARCATCGAARVPTPASKHGSTAAGASATAASAGTTGRDTAALRGSLVVALLGALVLAAGVLGYERAREALARIPSIDERTYSHERGVERREGSLHWRARVRSDSAAASTECALDATLITDGSRLEDVEMTVRCGEDLLYHGRRANGLACGMHEGPGTGVGNWEYDLGCTHRPGQGAPRFVVDTRASRAAVMVGDPPVAVELVLVREDGERTALALLDASIGTLRWKPERRFHAEVETASDGASVAVGTRCEARLVPVPLDELPCRAIVRCGETQLYGGFAQGFTTCTLGSEGPTLALDDAASGTDGDPMLRMDLVGRVAIVSDAEPTWSVQLRLVPK